MERGTIQGHSPLPWERRGGPSTHIICRHADGSERGVVAKVDLDGGTFTRDEAEANQELIVRATASYKDLLDAAEVAYIGLASGKGSVPFIITTLRVALRKAGSRRLGEVNDEPTAQEVTQCPADCGGCSCHIAPPCGHCTEGHGEPRG